MNRVTMAPRKLRLLCLHGMYQDSKAFQAKTRHLFDTVQDQIEMIYIDAPFQVVPRIITRPPTKSTLSSATNKPSPVNGVNGSTKCSNIGNSDMSNTTSKRAFGSRRPSAFPKKPTTDFRAWWKPLEWSSLHQEQQPAQPHVQEAHEHQFQQDRRLLLAFLQDQIYQHTLHDQQLDGVLGFSQGASLASWMCTSQAFEELSWRPKVAILMGGYIGPPKYFATESGVVANLSSLHMFGTNDCVIHAAKSQQLVDEFKRFQSDEERLVTLLHTKGHIIPKTDEVVQVFRSFLLASHQEELDQNMQPTQSSHQLDHTKSKLKNSCSSSSSSSSSTSSTRLPASSPEPSWSVHSSAVVL